MVGGVCAVALALALCPVPGLATQAGPQPGPLPDSPSQASSEEPSSLSSDPSEAPATEEGLAIDSSSTSRDATNDTATETQSPVSPTSMNATQAPRYSLTNLGQATPAKVQQPWGACWAFAVAGAVESSILKAEATRAGAPQQELASDSPAFAEPLLANLPTTPDVSERAIAWFAHEPQTEASGGAQAGEGFQLLDPSPEEQLSGGNFATAATALTAWQSLISEEAVPYAYNGYVAGMSQDWFDANAAASTRYEDWSLPDGLRTTEDVGWRVSEVLRLPSPANVNEQHEYLGYNPEAVATVKRTLVNTGGVAVALNMEQNIPADIWSGAYESSDPSEHFTFSTWSQYDGSPSVTQNHAAVIVGWDDAYPASAFQGTTSGQPPGDGAWLCKNSWGNDSLFAALGNGNAAPHWGLTDENGQASGYFWLSYYDHSVTDLEAFAVTPVSESYDTIYQHDFVGATEYLTPVKYTERVQTANVFTAKDTELLEAVTAWTFTANTGCAVTVGVLPVGFDANAATPQEVMAASTPMAQASGEFPDAGFHTLELDAPVLVMKGQQFTITLEIGAEPDALSEGHLAQDADSYLGLELGFTDAGAEGQTTSASIVANPGETFVNVDGLTWKPVSDFNAEGEALRQQYGKETNFVYGNAIVKGLANETTMADPGRVYEVAPLSQAGSE